MTTCFALENRLIEVKNLPTDQELISVNISTIVNPASTAPTDKFKLSFKDSENRTIGVYKKTLTIKTRVAAELELLSFE